jgi:hypothetical protein
MKKTKKIHIIDIKFKKSKKIQDPKEVVESMFKASKIDDRVTKKEMLYQANALGYDRSFRDILIATYSKIAIQAAIKSPEFKQIIKNAKKELKNETKTNTRRNTRKEKTGKGQKTTKRLRSRPSLVSKQVKGRMRDLY